MSVILCHKCCGVLDHTPEDKEHGLNGCQCMSGYVRGFECPVSIPDAATAQVQRELEWMALYASQDRKSNDSAYLSCQVRMTRALKACPHAGHGTIKWEELSKQIKTLN